MFSENRKSKKKANKKTDYSKDQNRISQGSVFTGDIESEGSFRIDGKFNGNIKTLGKVVLGDSGSIYGDVECDAADIEGNFEGKLNVQNQLNIKASANINGEIIAGQLMVEPGANLNGTCNMRGALKQLNNEREGKAQTDKKGKSA